MRQTPQPPRVPDSKLSQLPGLPDGPLSVQQQAQALKRVQAQAEQRVRLGIRLYRAAEAHTARHRSLLDEFQDEQRRLKEELQEDVARSLHAYDQWVGKIDESFTNALKGLEQRIDNLQDEWGRSQEQIDAMMRRSEALLDQSRNMVNSVAEAVVETSKRRSSADPAPPPTPPAPSPIGTHLPVTRTVTDTAEASLPPSGKTPPPIPSADVARKQPDRDESAGKLYQNINEEDERET